MKDSKWYFTFHMHLDSISIYQTSEYDGRGGYDNEEEATAAAIDFLDKKITASLDTIQSLSDKMAITTNSLSKILEAKDKLCKEKRTSSLSQ